MRPRPTYAPRSDGAHHIVKKAQAKLPGVVVTQYPPLRADGNVGQFWLLQGMTVPFTESVRPPVKLPQLPPARG